MSYHTFIKHQDLVALLGSRNLYLRVVYAHIANYTAAKGAWCGTQRELAEQLELPLATVSNQLTDLISRGIVVRESNKYRSAREQKCSALEQSCSAGEQKCSANEQNPVPPIPPLYINNKIKKEKGNSCAQMRDTTRLPEENLFNRYIAAFWLLVDRPDEPTATQREEAAKKAWRDNPDNRQLAYELIKYKHVTKKADPAFTIIDAQELRQNLPPPVNYYGLRLERFVDYYETYYNGQKGLYTADDVAFYKMPPPIKTYNAK